MARVRVRDASHSLKELRSPDHLVEKVVPDYPPGCKRILASNDYYDTLNRLNTRLVTTSIAEVTPGGLRTSDGVHHRADTIIWATGFRSQDFVAPMTVVGRHGHSPAYDTVTDDDHAGAHLVVAHLAGLGHRRIAHIEHHETDATRLAEMPNAIRANGYRDAMRAHGLAAEIDIANCEQACDQLSVAFIGGAAVVIADFPAPRIPTSPGREVP